MGVSFGFDALLCVHWRVGQYGGCQEMLAQRRRRGAREFAYHMIYMTTFMYKVMNITVEPCNAASGAVCIQAQVRRYSSKLVFSEQDV